MAHRLTRLFEAAGELDAIVLVNTPPDPAFFWASSLHDGGTFEGAAAVLRAGERPLILTPPLEETTARRSDNDVMLFSGKDGLYRTLADALDGCSVVGVHEANLPARAFKRLERRLPDVELRDASDAIETARLVKDDDEIERIRAACALTDAIADDMASFVARSSTEAELAAEIVRHLMAAGATTSFEPIVAAGAGSAEPHYSPGRVALADGPLLVDMGARLAGYCSDITRTFSLGPPSEDLARMHAVVHDALEAALDRIRPGVSGGEVHEAASEVIDATEFKGRFIHSTGHSLGVEVHDGPGLHPNHALTLAEGMVMTVEPGIYVPGTFGVRIEQDVVVTQDGCEQITQAARGLRDVRE